MAKYCITAARSSDETRELKDQFKTWERVRNEQGQPAWRLRGWKSIHEISDLLKDGHEVLTAKQGANGGAISTGALVELELRISDNESNYPISKMPGD